MRPTPFDDPAYGPALAHLGEPWLAAGWPGPLVRRAIPGTIHHDLIGVWPYASAPVGSDAAHAAFAAFRASGAVTFQALARPDEPVDAAALSAAGFAVRPFKTHYVLRPDRPAPAPGAKTRANLARARRTWRVAERPLADHLAAVCAWHEALARRRQMSAQASLPAAHFARLAALPAFTALFAEDDAGPAACLLVAAMDDRIHFHAIAGDERAYRERAFYALYREAVARWGADRTIYFGGAPGGPAGPGIARFKARFANDQTPVHLVTAVLDPAACDALAATRGTPGWFPPYRGPQG